MGGKLLRSAGRFLLIAASLCGWSVPGHAQAWVPERGTGEFSLAYQDLYTTDHLIGDGSRLKVGTVRILGVLPGLDYGLTNHLALSVALPYGTGKYSGSSPHQLPIDDGSFHGALQDLGVGLRYNLRMHPLAVTPFIRIGRPATRYEHFAHSAIGSQLRETQVGFSVGRRLDPLLHNSYFQFRYGFSWSQRILGIRPQRSRFDGEFGYFLSSRLAVRGIVNSQISHGGLDFPQDYPVVSPTNERWRHHDQISRINVLNVGGGASLDVTKSWAVFASLLHTVWGTNGHALKTGLTVGVSWSFRMPWVTRRSQFSGASTVPSGRSGSGAMLGGCSAH
jgi:hypothetical protein